ncbi:MULTISPECIES: hypothetical protein [unclassified Desulfovibrio]|uniref:hypothetical protein n=1 Tax=unclassified Desulfovibrio TaxID=2593640 RepID=UPI000F5F67E1|nr:MULTISPECIES: hypothetical protein [unclassified Desulfovibrio]RRD70860.1 hypothetical protein EII24_05405 [Desulfovibrio sp. OH1209_COT-279]RRD87248.1 hypothetical protein EII23_05405 [Desulfovibrio sp. OH1186_COT-070]
MSTPSPGLFLKRYFGVLLALAAAGCAVLLPYTCWWVFRSGDVAVERAVDAQAGGDFALFGSGISQDFVDYKLQLYARVKPAVAAVGSSRVMQFRSAYFRSSFLNVGGTAGNLPVLRSTLEAMLRTHRPEAVLIGLDFWWFMPQWNPDPFTEEPPTSGSYNYGFESLKKPWTWLLEGKISARDLAASLLPGSLGGFRSGRYGIMAQQTDDGFGPDGSWYYTGESTGQKRPFDYQFSDTLSQIRHGIKAFYRAKPLPDSRDAGGISSAHLDAFAEIYCRLVSRGIAVFVFISPLSTRALDAMRQHEADYPHLFHLRNALLERGINVMDFTDPRSFASGDCEFFDGFHGGEVTYVRMLRDMADRWPSLLAHVDMEKINAVIRDWRGHALVFDKRLTSLPEIDFMNFNCPKRTVRE